MRRAWQVRTPLNELLVWQRVNHFPKMKELCRKDALKRHLQRYNAMYTSGMFDFMASTFTLPKEYVQVRVLTLPLTPVSYAAWCIDAHSHVNSRIHVPQELTGLISLYTNPVSTRVPIQTVP